MKDKEIGLETEIWFWKVYPQLDIFPLLKKHTGEENHHKPPSNTFRDALELGDQLFGFLEGRRGVGYAFVCE